MTHHISIFDLFSIGPGPSSSHTVGPMRAARTFAENLKNNETLANVHSVTIDVFGSLALTGEGHGTPKAILNGLEGRAPESVDPVFLEPRLKEIIASKNLRLLDSHPIHFHKETHYRSHHATTLPGHPNTMEFRAMDKKGEVFLKETYHSVGGGFIERCPNEKAPPTTQTTHQSVPYPFHTAAMLCTLATDNALSLPQLMMQNELVFREKKTIQQNLTKIIDTMMQAMERGFATQGILPGGLNVARRAPGLYRTLIKHTKQAGQTTHEQTDLFNWLNVFAMAVSEENAAGGRVVTAPTNGAAGIIPAVLAYYRRFFAPVAIEKQHEFLLTSAAIGILYKLGASISGAEVGCQGEVGVAASMAAAALTHVLGGTLTQIYNAAEIAMEHHLGMTCDPIGGLVQIPCIERNAMGAVKAVNAARMAMLSETAGKVSLDQVIKTMKETGKDMQHHYKETALGGLAVNVTEC